MFNNQIMTLDKRDWRKPHLFGVNDTSLHVLMRNQEMTDAEMLDAYKHICAEAGGDQCLVAETLWWLRNNNGETPFLLACKNGHYNRAVMAKATHEQKLILWWRQFNMKDKWGKSAVDYNPEVSEFFFGPNATEFVEDLQVEHHFKGYLDLLIEWCPDSSNDYIAQCHAENFYDILDYTPSLPPPPPIAPYTPPSPSSTVSFDGSASEDEDPSDDATLEEYLPPRPSRPSRPARDTRSVVLLPRHPSHATGIRRRRPHDPFAGFTLIPN